MRLSLPEPITVELVAERDDAASERDFLRVRRCRLRNVYADGTRSDVFPYDMIERTAIDAVVILLESGTSDDPQVCLRSALRPPLAFRERLAHPISDPREQSVLWELPAGLIEPDEKGEEGVMRCAARETLEETGFSIEPARFQRLGAPTFLSPGVLAEKIHVVHAHVDSADRGIPTEDGSPVEARATVRFVSLRSALSAADDGVLCDAKTELALLRLAQRRRP